MYDHMDGLTQILLMLRYYHSEVYEILTMNQREAQGVQYLMLMVLIISGNMPSRAAANATLEPPRDAPFNTPIVEQATSSGTTKAKFPSVLSANVYQGRRM